MLDPQTTQRLMCAARAGGRNARRGYGWVSVFAIGIIVGAVCLKVILEVLT